MKQVAIVGLVLVAFACSVHSSETSRIQRATIQHDTLYFHCADSAMVVGNIKLWPDRGGLQGVHCMTAFNGNRIDCCLDSISITVTGQDGVLVGNMHSCYDDQDYPIKLQLSGKTLTLTFGHEEHPFLANSIEFIKD